MKELIRVVVSNNVSIVSSRDLYEFLEIKERFSRWFSRMLDFGYKNGKDYTPYLIVHPQNNQKIKDYWLTLDMGKELCMLARSPRGREARQYFIDRDNELRKLEKANIYKENTEWLITRKQGKLVRRNETDCLAEFIIYAREQGSKTPEKYYINFSKLVNKQVGIGKDMRDKVSITTLNHIANLENLIINTVKENMSSKVYYKDIYQICKGKCEQYKDLLQLEKIECKLIS